MKPKSKIWFYPIMMVGSLLLLINCSNKDGIKKVPVTITDINGNLYHTVVIGKQVWLKENLNVTNYSNGDPLTYDENISQWASLKTGVYCNYYHSTSNAGIYGHLYNCVSVIDKRNICPTGWHVPSSVEWETLINYLGGYEIAGAKLKETGIIHWASPNTDATNESGFTALPGGYLNDVIGVFNNINFYGCWWSTTYSHAKISNNNGNGPPEPGPRAPGYYVLRLNNNNNKALFSIEQDNLLGSSIRCLMDNYTGYLMNK